MTNRYEQALERFEQAVCDRAFKGCQHPEDHRAIEREYKEAKAALVRKLRHRENARELQKQKR